MLSLKKNIPKPKCKLMIKWILSWTQCFHFLWTYPTITNRNVIPRNEIMFQQVAGLCRSCCDTKLIFSQRKSSVHWEWPSGLAWHGGPLAGLPIAVICHGLPRTETEDWVGELWDRTAPCTSVQQRPYFATKSCHTYYSILFRLKMTLCTFKVFQFSWLESFLKFSMCIHFFENHHY